MGIRVNLERRDPAALDHLLKGKINLKAYWHERELPPTHLAMDEVHDPAEVSVLELDKYWDELLFLLSEERRRLRDRMDQWEHPYQEPAAWAVTGATRSYIADDNGHPLRYSTPEQVEAIDAYLKSITFDDLEQQWSDPAMRSARVYSRSGPFLSPRGVKLYQTILTNLRGFYRQAVQEGETVVNEIG